jgi:hypothetical protein
MLENMDVFVAISERQSPVYVCWQIGCIGRDVLRLSNLISDVVLIGMTYCAPVLLYEFILSSEFSMA